MYKRGEIVLIPVPFSNLQSSKRRPVIIISNDEYNGVGEDIIVAAITSNIRGLDNEIVFDSEDMEKGSLPKVSCVRADKIYTLSKEIVVKKYGSLNKRIIEAVKVRVEKLISE